jgi:CsoR family transcriptional regulator, copper-sensing transcriptional repressor
MTITTPATAARAVGPPGYSGRKADHLARLARIEGQVRGVTRMVEADRYCTDVLTQISAVTRALQEVALGLLDDHLRNCVTGAARSGPDQADEKLTELAAAFRRLLRA